MKNLKRIKRVNQLDSYLAKMEGKKSQTSIGNIREVRGLLCDLFARPGGDQIIKLMVTTGLRRAARRKGGQK